MTDIFKIAGIGLAGGMLSLFLKEYRREYAVLTALLTAAALLFPAVNILSSVVRQFSSLADMTGIRHEYIEVILKTVGIAYIAEFAAQVLKDAEQGAIASKVELAGKAMILYITFPVIKNFLEVCINAVNGI